MKENQCSSDPELPKELEMIFIKGGSTNSSGPLTFFVLVWSSIIVTLSMRHIACRASSSFPPTTWKMGIKWLCPSHFLTSLKDSCFFL